MNTTDAVKLKNINMLNDAIFKSLFRSSEAREMVSDFLNEILGIDKKLIMKAEFQGGELTKKVLTEKGKASDIIIKIEGNNKIILEMNQFDNDNIFRKNIDYVFTLATESTKVGKKTYPNVVMISFDNFNKLKTDKPILHFKLRDEYGNIESDQYNSIHLIIENIENGKYNVGKETRKLIKLLRQTTIEEMEKEFEGDEIYMACVRRVEELSTDPDFIGYYDIEEARRQENEDFEMTGFRKGREAGEKNKQIEIAKNLLSKNISIESISEITGLSIEEMEK